MNWSMYWVEIQSGTAIDAYQLQVLWHYQPVNFTRRCRSSDGAAPG